MSQHTTATATMSPTTDERIDSNIKLKNSNAKQAAGSIDSLIIEL